MSHKACPDRVEAQSNGSASRLPTLAAPPGPLSPPEPAAADASASRPVTVPALADALRSPARCGCRIARDRFLGRIMIANLGADPPRWQPLRDGDYTRIREHLQRAQRFKNIAKDVIRDVIEMVAEEQSFDSAQEWLAGRAWDGVPRVESFLPRCFGSADTPYTRALGKYIWTAMAARVLSPGAKADMVPVAVGPQGARKSTAIAAMAPNPEFVGELDLARRDDDTRRMLQGKLVVELPELRGLRGRDADSTKAFISATHDEWVEKYQALPRKEPRRCLFFGSTNEPEFLQDATGSRRWLPFDVGACDPELVARELDQLWAEGKELYLLNGVLFSEAERLARAVVTSYEVADPWQDLIQAYTDSPPRTARFDDDDDGDGKVLPWNSMVQDQTPAPPLNWVTAKELMKGPLQLTSAQMGKPTEQRVGAILRNLGWKRTQKRINGSKPINGWKRKSR